MTLAELNQLTPEQAFYEFEKCCGASNWAIGMVESMPFESEARLMEAADDVWQTCEREDWLEAFTHHPKIGDIKSLEKKFATTKEWAEGEQGSVATAQQEVLEKLAQGNTDYEEKFGYIFIVCATGKSAEEMLAILESRLPNDADKEILIAKDEQHKITKLRLEKLLS